MSEKLIRKELKEQTEPDFKNLGKFNPDDFKTCDKDAFKNLLAQTFGGISCGDSPGFGFWRQMGFER